MNNTLLKILVERNHFIPSTEVLAKYKVRNLCGSYINNAEGFFTVIGLKNNDDTVSIELSSVSDGRIINAKPEDIITIDGMSPERFASNFMLDKNGDPLKKSKRRGRIPKSEKISQL